MAWFSLGLCRSSLPTRWLTRNVGFPGTTVRALIPCPVRPIIRLALHASTRSQRDLAWMWLMRINVRCGRRLDACWREGTTVAQTSPCWPASICYRELKATASPRSDQTAALCSKTVIMEVSINRSHGSHGCGRDAAPVSPAGGSRARIHWICALIWSYDAFRCVSAIADDTMT